MGLDSVELVMAIEDEFEILLPETEVIPADTVGKVVDLVYARLRHSEQQPCPSQHGFYVVRRTLMERLGLKRSAIKPGSQLGSLIPQPDRRRVWPDLLRRLTDDQTTWPGLVRPKWLKRALAIFVLGVLAISCFAVVKWLSLYLLGLGLFAALGVAVLSIRLTEPFRTEFPKQLIRVKDLIRFVKTLHSRIWSKEEVFQKIREIVVDLLGVKPEQVTLNSHWVYDLGLDR